MTSPLPEPSSSRPSRRNFLLLSLGVLATGCVSSPRAGSLPDPHWPNIPVPDVPNDHSDVIAGRSTDGWSELPSGAMARSGWSRGAPVPTLMDRMIPIRYITVHHDGMNAFYGESQSSAASRIENIRRGHRGRGWGDIGYHFIVDRSGRVWEGRPLSYQGAHVKDHNEGNIGIMCLGNFEVQTPSVAQLGGLNRYLSTLMVHYRVPIGRVRTHQEWAKTACPGRHLQRHMVSVRSNRQLG